MSSICWGDDSSAIGWLKRSFRVLFGLRAARAKVWDSDDAPSHYLVRFHAPVRGRADLRKAAELALPQLMPVSPEALDIHGRISPEGVELCAFHSRELSQWWTRQGIRDRSRLIRVAPDWTVMAPLARRSAERRRLIVATSLMVTLASAVVLYFGYLDSIYRQIDHLVAEERRLRTVAVEAARRREEANLWTTLQNAYAPQRLPANVAKSIAMLSQVAPDGSFWTRLEWAPEKILLVGLSKDPVGVLEAYADIENLASSFATPVRKAEGGTQEFQIQLVPRRGPK